LNGKEEASCAGKSVRAREDEELGWGSHGKDAAELPNGIAHYFPSLWNENMKSCDSQKAEKQRKM
jgi:hypothetical protein